VFQKPTNTKSENVGGQFSSGKEDEILKKFRYKKQSKNLNLSPKFTLNLLKLKAET